MSEKVFLSYKRDDRHGRGLVVVVRDAFDQAGIPVFIDRQISAGAKWAERIQKEIRDCSVLIVFLTRDSVQSDMLGSEVKMARGFGKKIVPVRVAFRDELPHPLNAYLDSIQAAEWNSESDTERLVRELADAVVPGASQRVKPIIPSKPWPRARPVAWIATAVVAALITAGALYYLVFCSIEVHFTQVPGFDPVGGNSRFGEFSGKVTGCGLRQYQLVIYSETVGGWYVQPFDYAPTTPINPDTGQWRANIHLGAKYAALVVRPGFKVQPRTLPPVGGDVVAVGIVPGTK